MSNNKISRRWFIMSSAVLAAGCATSGKKGEVAKPVSATKAISPNEKLNVAGIGVGGKGESDIAAVGQGNNVVALCDVDWNRAGASFDKFPNARRYKDFREMLDKEANNIDAVTISTPDHTHAIAAMACMQLGKSVFVQKPLTHDIYEARILTEAARKYKVATHMGNQGHQGEGIRRVCEWVQGGLIGQVKEVHIWTNRPVWPQGIGRPLDTPPVPDTLDWDLWVGPAPMRPYNPAYVPFAWRGWWDFGCGALGDMACHIMDAAFTSLKLGYPTSVSAKFEGANEETAPLWSIIHYKFPERPGMNPVDIYWYDGGKLPERPAGIPDNEKLGDGDNGSLFIGEKGMITCGEYAGEPRPVPYAKPDIPKSIPRSIGHYQEFIRAAKGGEPAGGNFDYAGPFTEMVLLGNLAIRCGGSTLEWDGPKMTCTNNAQANQYVKREYRSGWDSLDSFM